jgi:hemerythrin-like domain-containing protein
MNKIYRISFSAWELIQEDKIYFSNIENIKKYISTFGDNIEYSKPCSSIFFNYLNDEGETCYIETIELN